MHIIALAASVMLAASCGVLPQGATATTPMSGGLLNASSGKNAGSALYGLYSQYKTDGKLDLSNINNIINLATLASNCQGLKNTTADTGSFLGGLISGSGKLVNQNNGSLVLEGLKKVASANLNSINSAASTYAANAAGKAAGAVNAAADKAVSTVNANASGVTSAITALSSIFNTFAK